MTGGVNNDDGDDDNDDLCDRERSKPEWQHLDHRPSFRPIALGSTALHRVALVSIALHWDAQKHYFTLYFAELHCT